MSTCTYPVRVDASLQNDLSRWLWLVKWFLVLPHYLVLGFLWLAYLVLSVVAFVAILFTGRYPRGIFDFNVGVLRWSWRVAYYAYGGLGTDQYPPFSLDERPDYPAHLEISYPEKLSRGLVLVKWWLLAIPHYLVLALLVGSGWWVSSSRTDAWTMPVWHGGLIELLVLVAAVGLLVTGAYPRAIFDLVLGLNRWVLRVAAYVSLMTDDYPPFRLDQGGTDPGTSSSVVAVPPTTDPGPGPVNPAGTPHVASPGPMPPRRAWSAGRVVTVVLGALMLLTSSALLTGGLVLLVADEAARDGDGYITSSTVRVESPGSAVLTEEIVIDNDSVVVDLPERLVGTVKVAASAARGDVFVGIGESEDVDAYLDGVARSILRDPTGNDGSPTYDVIEGDAPTTPPDSKDFWLASAQGPGQQTATLTPDEGNWTVVVMNADGSNPVTADVAVGATVPILDDLAYGLLTGAGLMLIGGGVVLWASLRRRTP
jgi:hypothetical protein